MKYIVAILTCVFISIISCVPPASEGFDLQIHLTMPPESGDTVPQGTEVKLINTANGTTYTAPVNAKGFARFHADYGIYRLTTQFMTYSGDTEYLFNGGMEDLRLTPENSNVNGYIQLTLGSSKRSRIIIKEIYYAGCYDPNGKTYARDAYVSLYNNSSSTLWLDSLCIGLTGPTTANKTSSWLTHTPDLVPVLYMGWQFPGRGKDYPLAPGATVTIGVNAVNHTNTEYNHPNSVDLSKAGWAFYHPTLSGTDIATGVTPLYMFKRYALTTFYMFSILGSGMILYRIHNISSEEYAANPANFRKEPNSASNMDYLMIPVPWVVDCIDCVENASKQGFKRFPVSLDAEPAYLPSGKYSGRALRRKIAGEDNGRIIYQDTNNSFNDFEETIPEMRPQP